MLLSEDPKAAVPREQAVLELWDLTALTSRVVSRQAARDFELAWLSESRFLMAEAQADEIVAIEQDLSLKATSRHEIARVRAKYPRLAVSALYPRGLVLYDRNRPLDVHCWVLEDPSGRAWEEVHLPQRQLRIMGWWKDQLILLERSSITNSRVLSVPRGNESLATSIARQNRPIATLPVADFGILADGSVYLVSGGSWQQNLTRLRLETGQTSKLALPLGARTVHKPYALGAESLSVLFEGPFLPPQAWQFQLEHQRWKPLRSSPLTGLDLAKYQCRVEADRVVLSKKEGLSGYEPVLLESYGAFRQTLPPVYDPVRLEWLRCGGKVILAQLQSAPLGQEQTISSLHRSAQELSQGPVVYRGRSFGATLGLMTEIRFPGTFQAIWADAALTDLLNYPSLEPGTLWLAELGDPTEPSQRQHLEKLSPLSTLEASFPPTVLSSARNDRVVDFRHVWSFVRQAERVGTDNVFLFEQNGGSHSSTGTSWQEDLKILDFLWRKVAPSSSDKGTGSRGGRFPQ